MQTFKRVICDFCLILLKQQSQRMRKKNQLMYPKLIKALCHCSLPQTSRFDSSGPALSDVSKSIANLRCGFPACSSLHGQCYLLALGYLLRLLVVLLMFQDCISYIYSTTQNSLLPLSVTWRRFLQNPEPTSQPSRIRHVIVKMANLNKCTWAHSSCFHKLRSQCSWKNMAGNVNYLCSLVQMRKEYKSCW